MSDRCMCCSDFEETVQDREQDKLETQHAPKSVNANEEAVKSSAIDQVNLLAIADASSLTTTRTMYSIYHI